MPPGTANGPYMQQDIPGHSMPERPEIKILKIRRQAAGFPSRVEEEKETGGQAITPEVPVRQSRSSRETGEKNNVFICTVLYSLIT